MNPQTAKIPKTILPLATTHAGGNVIPPTTNSVSPPLIDWNLLAATNASYAAAPFVVISRMISVIIGVTSSKIVIQGEEAATMPSPTILMRSALDACSASHVDALDEKEEGASAFEEEATLEITKTRTLEEIIAGGDNALAQGSEDECALALAFKETIGYGLGQANMNLMNPQTILRGLGGADANRMTSQTLEITKTSTLEEIIAGGDNALAQGSEEECALALAFEDVVSY
ncbi:hypothetical protein ACHAW5_007002 [Stephanodiscus triporus]|uniref:Uncharacterized protein n=1 Tax=Stephanodiscus triporus TaxID=2934178 RepID=A0ABD3N0D3_9STRA